MAKRTERQARDVYDRFLQHHSYSHNIKCLNTTEFINFVAEQAGYELESAMIPRDNGMSGLRGMLLKDSANKKALMLISDENNVCWKRFTAIKEACHFFLVLENNIECDDALKMATDLAFQSGWSPGFLPNDSYIKSIVERYNADPENVQDITIQDVHSALVRENPNGVAEVAAVVAAIEIMIPQHLRDYLCKQIEDNMSVTEVAKIIRVPAIMLERRLKNWGVDCGE